MAQCGSPERAGRLFAVVIVLAASHLFCRAAFADIILFTASTDFTGGFNTIVPNSNNQYIPSVSNGVTLSPDPAYLNNQNVGPLDGISYGPSYSQVSGIVTGTTGWVTSTVTVPVAGQYQLIWEVANVIHAAGADALATGNIRLNNQPLFQFSNGLPADFTALGSDGTSGGISGLAPTGADGAFAWLDVQPPPHSTNVAPLFDPLYSTGLGDGYSASRLYSAPFEAVAGDTLQLDSAFLTNDGGNYADYGIIALQAVPIPEPSSLTLAVLAGVGLATRALTRRLKAFQAPLNSRPAQF